MSDLFMVESGFRVFNGGVFYPVPAYVLVTYFFYKIVG